MTDLRQKSEKELQEDAEANAFAVALLMPEEMVRESFEKIREMYNNDPTEITQVLSRQYEVSYTMMANRLVELKLLAIAI